MLVNAEAEVNRRKADFAKSLTGMDEGEKNDLLNGLGEKLANLNAEMEVQKKLQDDRLRARLAARERKRKAGAQLAEE
jgi:hypothetical protein